VVDDPEGGSRRAHGARRARPRAAGLPDVWPTLADCGRTTRARGPTAALARWRRNVAVGSHEGRDSGALLQRTGPTAIEHEIPDERRVCDATRCRGRPDEAVKRLGNASLHPAIARCAVAVLRAPVTAVGAARVTRELAESLVGRPGVHVVEGDLDARAASGDRRSGEGHEAIVGDLDVREASGTGPRGVAPPAEGEDVVRDE
jgi:hypothetical protein